MCYIYFFVYIVASLIFIFSIIRTLDYLDFLLRSRRVRIIEVRLYVYQKKKLSCREKLNLRFTK